MPAYPPEKEALLEIGKRNVVIVAPPGCGKTEALALRAKGLIQSGEVRAPQRILALTFSNRARDNLNARLRITLGDALYLRCMTVSNFHGFAARVYRAHAATIGLSPESVMPEKGWLGSALQSLGANSKMARQAESIIREVKLKPFSDEQVLESLASMGADYALQVERLRISEDRLDFPDLLRHCQRILAVEAVSALYRGHFGGVLVDEFQDLTEQQLDIVMALGGDNMTLAGDPAQAIYSFAGADVEAVSRRIAELSDVKRVEFTQSYRSSPHVLKVVNAIGGPLGVPSLSSVEPEKWFNGGVVSCRKFVGEAEEADYVFDLCSALMVKDPKLSIGVISRVNYRRGTVDNRFRSTDLFPVRLWENPAYSPEVIKILRREVQKISLAGGLDEASKWDLLESGCLAAVEPTDVDLLADMQQALEFLSGEIAGGITLEASVLGLRVSENELAPIGPGAHLLNAHVGKGQQFDWVCVVGVEEGLIPDFRAKDAKSIAEERRTLLVMASRAKYGILATSVSHVNGLYGPRMVTVSRWWEILEGASTSQYANPRDLANVMTPNKEADAVESPADVAVNPTSG